MTSPCRVYVVEDHPVFRLGLRALLARHPEYEIVGEAGDLRAARQGIAQHRPDLVLLDLVLEGGNGTELLPWLKTELPQGRVLVVSMLDELLYAERCLRIGAGGYLQKSQAPVRLLEAIERVMSGDVYLGEAAARRLLRRVAGGMTVDEDPMQALTDRELEVFQLIGQGYRTAEIAESLFLSPKTVETHQARIRRKLGAQNALELTRLAVIWVEQGGDVPEA